MSIPRDCKRLAEVDFPIATVSRHAAREKSIRHGHPSTLHLWWARRPLASSRAMLLALLLPDPQDPLCPPEFKIEAHELLSQVQRIGGDDASLRGGLLKFIGDFANWELASNAHYVALARGLVRAAHAQETPLVVDPFAGGGSIPLEALRLGCDTYASDLNPVAALILQLMLQDIPRLGHEQVKVHTEHGEIQVDGLAGALKLKGIEIRKAAERELAVYYPSDPDGARPIAYLWARTVRCESPNCGAEIPLIRSFWLSKKANRRRVLLPRVTRHRGEPPSVTFEIVSPPPKLDKLPGTVSHANAHCPCCGATLPAERVRSQLRDQVGGANVIFNEAGKRVGGARLIAVTTLKDELSGRNYRLPTERDYDAIWAAKNRLVAISAAALPNRLTPIPNEPLPPIGTLGFRVQRYGAQSWGDLFTFRQNLALYHFSCLAQNAGELQHSLLLVLGKLTDLCNAMSIWEPVAECPRQVMTQGRVKPSWDFAEGVPISDSSASFAVCLANHIAGIASIDDIPTTGQVAQEKAQESPLPDDSADVWFTDPPYYDAIPYADLSDFFYTRFTRSGYLGTGVNQLDTKETALTPKLPEIVSDESKSTSDGRTKDRGFFEQEMSKAFSEGRRILKVGGIGSVVFAHKSTEGWEALLAGMTRGGWVITGSWPIATEMAHRLRARDSAALATSVHLVCRPRPLDAGIGDWTHVSRELPRKISHWMHRLQSEGVRGADLVFACIGPALEIYSRYSKVVDSEDREIPLGGDPEAREPHLRGFLAYVWEVVGRLALEQILGTDETHGAASLEEDARLTALFLWTREAANHVGEKLTPEPNNAEDEVSDDEDEEEEKPRRKPKAGYSLPFDVVRRFAQPLGIHLPEWEDRILSTEKGVVTLLPVKDRSRQLFGSEVADAFASGIEEDPGRPSQMSFLQESNSPPKVRGGRRSKKGTPITLEQRRATTTLDRLHAAMLLQRQGQTPALRALLKAETDRGPEFMRLANSLSALYPRDSEEKRWLDALLVNTKR